MTMLQIARNFELPPEAVTETFAMLAKRGSGKSNAAVVMAEEMHKAGYQWVAIDPKGDWWGIRSSRDGKKAGLPIAIFGGQHGDIPLEHTAGALMARLIIEQSITCVLDVSLFTKGEQIRFVTDFAEALFRAISADKRPMHLFLEEAEEFLPQNVRGDTARMVGAYSKIAKQGRTAGLGVTLITQRSASLNKDALSQTDTLILFRTSGPHDRKAVVAWADYHVEKGEIAETLSGLEPGESWIISPGFLGTITRITWRRRSTFDSGATPVVGVQQRKAPISLADIDLGAIETQMADTVEKAKANDPKELRKRIKELEAELAKRPTEPVRIEIEVPVEVPVETRVEVPTVPAGLIESLRAALAAAEAIDPSDVTVTHISSGPKPAVAKQGPNSVRVPLAVKQPPAAPRRVASTDEKIGKGEWKVMQVLAEYPEGRTHSQLAFLAGYSAKASTVGVILAKLRRMGLVEDGNPIRLTDAGKEITPIVEQPTGEELLAKWMNHPRIGEGERKILRVLIDCYSNPALTKTELAEFAGYSTTASTVGVIVSKLRKLGLMSTTAIALDDDFASSIGIAQ